MTTIIRLLEVLDLRQIQNEHRKAHHDLNQLIHIYASHPTHAQQSLVEFGFLEG